MKASWFWTCVGALVLGAGLAGCSVSVSASAQAGGKYILEGKDKIVVTAAQPAAPEPEAKPAPAIKPVALKAKRVGKKIEITEKVMFDTDKATIKVDSHQLLKDVALVLTENATVSKLRVEGHTDADGSDKYNKKLSQQRADSVKAFLVSVGIDANRLEAVGYGEEKPIADNGTEDGKEKNRRVEFNIIGEAGAPAEGSK